MIMHSIKLQLKQIWTKKPISHNSQPVYQFTEESI